MLVPNIPKENTCFQKDKVAGIPKSSETTVIINHEGLEKNIKYLGHFVKKDEFIL